MQLFSQNFFARRIPDSLYFLYPIAKAPAPPLSSALNLSLNKNGGSKRLPPFLYFHDSPILRDSKRNNKIRANPWETDKASIKSGYWFLAPIRPSIHLVAPYHNAKDRIQESLILRIRHVQVHNILLHYQIPTNST